MTVNSSLLGRRAFLIGAATATAAVAAPAISYGAPKFRLRWSAGFPATHPIVVNAMAAAKRITEQTNGAVEVQVFPDSQLGNDSDVLTQVRSGGIDIQMIGGEVLTTLIPRAGMYGMGFAFGSYDQVWKAMDGELGAFLRDEIKAGGLHVMDRIWDNGFRQITSKNTVINSVDDVKGFKLRVPGSPVYISLFEALGAAPTAINWADLYPALQTGIVDGQENPLTIIQSARFFEVQNYCALSNHMWVGTWCIANRQKFDSFPADIREIVEKNLNQAAMDERAENARQIAELRATLEKEGMKFTEPDLDSFRKKLSSGDYYASWKSRYGDAAWAILEKFTGPLG